MNLQGQRQQAMNRISLNCRALCIAALLCAGPGAAYAADDKKPAEAKASLTVTTALPQPAKLPIRLAANGSIAAWQEASIGTETAGLRLSEVRAQVGDQVRAGQVLAVFASDAVQADIALAQAGLLEAEANAADAAGNAERARAVAGSGALSAQQVNQYLTAEQTSKARVQAARAALGVQQLRLRNTQLLAPDSGIIAARSATVGAVPGSGTELFRMIRQGRLEWRAELTSAELGRVKRGTPALVTAADGTQLRGQVRVVAPTVDPQTRFGLVYVDLRFSGAGSSPARAGMFAKGEFALGDSAALTLPQSAIVMRDGFSYLYRLGADSRVARIKVQTGRMAGDRIEITSELAPDTRVVTSGAGFLNDGDLVRVVDSAGLAKAPAPPAKTASTVR